jgi:hypothetical protein
VQEHELGHGGNKFGFSCAAQLPWAKEACFAFLSSPSNLKEMMSSDGSQKQLPVRPFGADGKISSS